METQLEMSIVYEMEKEAEDFRVMSLALEFYVKEELEALHSLFWNVQTSLEVSENTKNLIDTLIGELEEIWKERFPDYWGN